MVALLVGSVDDHFSSTQRPVRQMDTADFEHDLAIANRTSFSGGSGVLTSGALPRNVALRGTQVFYALTIVLIVLVGSISLPAGVVGLAALVIAWTYSMPPVRLVATGLGELATAICVAGLVPLAGVLSQQDEVPNRLWVMMTALVSLQVMMLLAFELPDLEADEQTGKRSLGVRLGPRVTQNLMALLTISAALFAANTWWTALALPTAIGVFIAFRKDGYGVGTFCAVATFFSAALDS